MAPRRFPMRMQRTSPKSNNNFLLPFEPRLDNSPFPNIKNIRLYHNKFNRKPLAFDDFNKGEFSEEEEIIS